MSTNQEIKLLHWHFYCSTGHYPVLFRWHLLNSNRNSSCEIHFISHRSEVILHFSELQSPEHFFSPHPSNKHQCLLGSDPLQSHFAALSIGHGFPLCTYIMSGTLSSSKWRIKGQSGVWATEQHTKTPQVITVASPLCCVRDFPCIQSSFQWRRSNVLPVKYTEPLDPLKPYQSIEQ